MGFLELRTKVADCLSRLVKPITTLVNMLTASSTDGPAFHTRSHTHNTSSSTTSQLHTQIQHVSFLRNPLLPKNHSQQIDWKHYYKCRRLTHSVCTFPGDYWMAKHLTMNLTLFLMSKDSSTNISWMLVKSFSLWSFLNLGNIWYSWEAHDKLGHQGNSCTYCLIKCQYYWKGMNKDIRKYIANCVLCQWENAKVQQYPLKMIEIPDRPFDKIAIDLVTDWWNLNIRQQTHPNYNRSLNRIARSIPHPWQVCRYNSCYIYQWIPVSTHVLPLYFV